MMVSVPGMRVQAPLLDSLSSVDHTMIEALPVCMQVLVELQELYILVSVLGERKLLS